MKEAAPAISRVAVFSARPESGPRAKWRDEVDAAGREMRLDVLWIGVDAPVELEAAFARTVREHGDALYIPSNSVNYTHRHRIADFALKQRLPSIAFPDGVVAGMLLSYAADDTELMRRAAFLVKKILDGAKPADLPFEQATKYSLVINLKTAKALGLTIPPSLMLRADEVIQ